MNDCHRNIEQHVIPAIGDIPLNKLTTRDLQKLYNDLQSSGRLRAVQKKEKPRLSNSTVRGIHMMLHNALDRAVKEKLILKNPTEDCIIPKIEKQEMKILQPEHIHAYLDAANARGLLPMFYLELVSGLRKGELTALQWSDLDEANCTISVSRQASWDAEHRLILSRPKTGNSILRDVHPAGCRGASEAGARQASRQPVDVPVQQDRRNVPPRLGCDAPQADPQGRRTEAYQVPRPEAHVRNLGTPKRSRRQNSQQYARAL